MRVLARMEHVGVGVDIDELRQLNQRLTADCKRLQDEVQRVAGRRLQPQLAHPSSARSCSTSAACRRRRRRRPASRPTPRRWRSLRDQWPEFIEPLLQYREVEKLRSHLRRGPAGRGRRPTAASTPRSTRPWPAPAGCRATSPTCTTSRCARDEGRAVPQGVRAAPGLRAAGRRLQPDRAALHRPPRRGPGPHRGVHQRPGHPQRHGLASVLRRARRRSRSSSARRRRWCRTGWPTAWRPTGSGSG